MRKVWRKNTQMLFVAAKIDLNLNPQNRLKKDSIAKSAAQKEIAGDKFAVHLGNRIQHVEILNEKDCVRVKPKCWMDKHRFGKRSTTYCESASICMACKGQGYSCWIKMQG
jgi:hypothetical protein